MMNSINKKRMVLVGNGVINGNYGEIIDGFDIIVRFNDYQIKGFERCVGSKMTHFVGVNNTSDDVYETAINILSLYSVGDKRNVYFDKYNNTIKEKVSYMDSEVYNECCAKYTSPTTGIIALEYYLKHYPEYEISIIGMDGHKTGHYYEIDHKHWFKHKGWLEYKTFKKYSDEGKIKFLNNRDGEL